MARSTGSRSTLKDIIRMASCARHLHMGAVQRELGQIVIKSAILPIGDGVAGFACRSKLALVCIIFLVAGIAILRRALIPSGDVALVAGSRSVLAFKFEFRQVVIKCSWFPTLRAVTSPALLAKSSSMNVIF